MYAQAGSFLGPDTYTMTHVIHAGPGSPCAMVGSAFDHDSKSGCATTHSADRAAAFIEAQSLRIEWLLKTHVHADHLSAAPYLHGHFGGCIATGERIRAMQGVFKPILNLEHTFLPDGLQFGYLFAPGEVSHIGNFEAKALAVSGHTPTNVTYQVDDVVFVGDTLFMPGMGTARCDFPGGNAGMLYQSVRRLPDLPPDTRLYMCYDYPSGGREAMCYTAVVEQHRTNIYVHGGATEAEFVQMRTKRDTTFGMPTLMLSTIQVNIRAGVLFPAKLNGMQYLKIPLNAL